MLDIKFIRENKALVAAAAGKKRLDFDIDRLIEIDNQRRVRLAKVEDLRGRQNRLTEAIAAGPERREQLLKEVRALKEELQKEEQQLTETVKEWQRLMIAVPNIPDVSVPDGDGDEDNQEIRRQGKIPEFSFAPKNHLELLGEKGLADFERGVKVAGFRGYFLRGWGARLNFALWQFTLEHFLSRHPDFELLLAPALVRRESFVGTGYLPQGEEDLYKTQDGNFLSGTSEVAVMGGFMDEIFEEKNLPVKILSFSECFRREAGSYGQDAKGLIRLHEFFKFEQVILCAADHRETVKWHEAITQNGEELMQALEIPYRLVINCGADLGLGQVKKYDIEAWLPAENRFRETHSSSYFHDFQTRRLNIRYRTADGKLKFAHSLNATALASPRILAALAENCQLADGAIAVPEVLRPYLGGAAIIGR